MLNLGIVMKTIRWAMVRIEMISFVSNLERGSEDCTPLLVFKAALYKHNLRSEYYLKDISFLIIFTK